MRRRQIYAAMASQQQIGETVARVCTTADDHIVAQMIPPPADKNACPNCGKVYPRGLHLHMRACKK